MVQPLRILRCLVPRCLTPMGSNRYSIHKTTAYYKDVWYLLKRNRQNILKNIELRSITNRAHQEFVEVTGSITSKDKKLRSDIRLKGDRKIHFVDRENSSYKLELDRNQYLFGIKKFSIQKPRVRNYIHEWLFHELSKDQNLIKIKYNFINLSINGDDKGLYVIEEGFGKELIFIIIQPLTSIGSLMKRKINLLLSLIQILQKMGFIS